MQKCRALFHLGQVITAADVCERHGRSDVNIGLLLQRHVLGDWGSVPDAVRYQNNRALRASGMMTSEYDCHDHMIRIVTNASQQYTSISVRDRDEE